MFEELRLVMLENKLLLSLRGLATVSLLSDHKSASDLLATHALLLLEQWLSNDKSLVKPFSYKDPASLPGHPFREFQISFWMHLLIFIY